MAFVFFSDDTQYIILMMYDTMGTLAQNRGEILILASECLPVFLLFSFKLVVRYNQILVNIHHNP